MGQPRDYSAHIFCKRTLVWKFQEMEASGEHLLAVTPVLGILPSFLRHAHIIAPKKRTSETQYSYQFNIRYETIYTTGKTIQAG